MEKKLYNITKDEAKFLFQCCNYDVISLGLSLWVHGVAATKEQGLDKAERLLNFIKKG